MKARQLFSYHKGYHTVIHTLLFLKQVRRLLTSLLTFTGVRESLLIFCVLTYSIILCPEAHASSSCMLKYNMKD